MIQLLILLTTACVIPVQQVSVRADRESPGFHQELADQFKPLTESDRIELATQTSTALTQFDRELNSREPAESRKWRNSFELDELRDFLETDSTDPDRIRAIERSFYGLTHELESNALIDLRRALSSYTNFLRIYALADVRAEFENRLNALDQAFGEQVSPDAVHVARQVDWLIAARQTSELVARLQRQFQYPSIVIDVNTKLVMPHLESYRREISKSKFTNNTIVGVPVSGMSHFSATVRPKLVENPQRATVRLELDGTIDSPLNDSRPDPQRAPLIGNVSVKLKTTGTTAVKGYKEIYWNGARLASDPAIVDCETDAKVNNVAISRNYRFPRSRMARGVDNRIRKKTHEEVQKKSPQANRQSASIARRQVSEQLDAEVQELLAAANEEIDQVYRAPLVGLGTYPSISSQSSRDAIRIGLRGENYGGIGSSSPPPNRELIGDVEVTLHESMCSNLWAGFLRGRQLTDEDFKNVHRELRGFVPMPLRISGNRSWAVRLSAELPLEARFRNGLVTITLHIESWTTDGVWQQKAVSISASYRVEPEINMPRFVRDGDVQIVWHQVRADQPDPSSTQREFIRSKFDAFFARELYLDGLSAPVGNEWGPAAKLKIVASEIHSGWWRVIFKSDELNRLN